MTYERFPDVFEFRCPNCSLVARFGYCSASIPAGLDAAKAKALMAWNRRPACANDSQTGKAKVPEPGWISVKDRLPVEIHSIFWPWYGKKEWSKAMWREQSDKVLVTVKFKDGSEFVTTGETHDGVWHTTISRTLEHAVTHWMPLPEPPKEG
jgi:Protein of unknown function (DUF551).